MVPKEFRERVLQKMDGEIKLNYLKWLSNGLDIDIFEIMSVLIFYARCDKDRTLACKFTITVC